jgi:hypothetical protein
MYSNQPQLPYHHGYGSNWLEFCQSRYQDRILGIHSTCSLLFACCWCCQIHLMQLFLKWRCFVASPEVSTFDLIAFWWDMAISRHNLKGQELLTYNRSSMLLLNCYVSEVELNLGNKFVSFCHKVQLCLKVNISKLS